jgi:phosphomannomutase
MSHSVDIENINDARIVSEIHRAIINEPQINFTCAQIAQRLKIESTRAEKFLEYLADIEREYEETPSYRGIAKVFLRGQVYYEMLSDNSDVRRDYDFRASNEGGRDFCPKNMFYYVWAWINLAEEFFKQQNVDNNHTILLTNDCRHYFAEIIETAKKAALLRGYNVVFAFSEGKNPSCVSSYSHAARIVRPCISVFITASHLSRPIESTVVGAKVYFWGSTGKLESMTTPMIKTGTREQLLRLKSDINLHRHIRKTGHYKEIEVGESHTRLAVAGVLAALQQLPKISLYSLAKRLKDTPEIDTILKSVVPTKTPEVFKGLRIVVEGAHTSSGPLASRALKALGSQVILLHGSVEAIEGAHKADPSISENLKDLFEEITRQNAHMGIAFDLDGDRGAVVLPDKDGKHILVAPDRLGQVLIPFLMKDCGYGTAEKPFWVRCCLSTDALVDQGRKLNLPVDTTDAGYVHLKRREIIKNKEGFIAIGMGEASGHSWLDYTGAFENPIVLSLIFIAMGIKFNTVRGLSLSDPLALKKAYDHFEIPYRSAVRFQPLFSQKLIEEVSQMASEAGLSRPAFPAPITQKIIGLCRSESIKKLTAYFKEGRVFETDAGCLKVARLETQFDEEDEIYRYGKIYFSLGDILVGSFVSRGSSNDPTAVQIWEVREFEGPDWNGQRLPDNIVQKRFDAIGGVVLDACDKLGILELTDKKPSVNMPAVLASFARYKKANFLS